MLLSNLIVILYTKLIFKFLKVLEKIIAVISILCVHLKNFKPSHDLEYNYDVCILYIIIYSVYVIHIMYIL